MNNKALHKLFQWLSPAYPVGAFSYSHGLEWAISQGEISDAASLKGWLSDIVQFGSGRNDAILLVHAFRAQSREILAEIAQLAAAFVPGKERLLETQSQGEAFAKITRTIWPGDLANMAYPVVVGAAAHQHDLELEATVSLYLHAFVANLVSAAVRFVPLGQSEGQKIVAELFDVIEIITKEALKASLDDLGGCSYRADMASMHHETQSTRIFRS